ncbi:Mor transcription activator family protein [Psychrobacter aquaticus]|uniref:Putative bacteriophage transcriptional regulator n=1 Tax=Psychrobacter aquaticus CMS 56 TaxID=1354303 RepID=U4T5J6_9GAMM|nr:Mor transcription activator family protein [Psychrobacter aquaticus]ERL56175.1 putative bacteriophage transcriptional regulator [Psychrobacter aquaticus CMS 56]
MSDTQTDGKFTKLGTAFLQDMVGHGADVIASYTDIPTEAAEQIAFHLAERMTIHWGGSMLYVPKNSPLKLHKRDLEIWQAFTGNNQHQLAQKYNLSIITIYQIIAKIRKSLPDKQKDLFDE